MLAPRLWEAGIEGYGYERLLPSNTVPKEVRIVKAPDKQWNVNAMSDTPTEQDMGPFKGGRPFKFADPKALHQAI